MYCSHWQNTSEKYNNSNRNKSIDKHIYLSHRPRQSNGNVRIYLSIVHCVELIKFICIFLHDKSFVSRLTMTFNSTILEISLVFARSYRSWYLNSTSVKTTAVDKTYVLKYQGLPYGLETPFKYSYACEESRFYLIDTSVPKIKPNSKVQIYFEKFQVRTKNTKLPTKTVLNILNKFIMSKVQPFNVPSPNQTVYQFGTVNYCNGFFSNAIWMGLITTLLLATILSCGLMGLSSVSTMDKFDDPKGKQLVIAAEK